MMKLFKKKTLVMLAILGAISVLLSGCSSSDQNNDGPKEISILGENEQQLRDQFTQYYETANSNVTVKVTAIENSIESENQIEPYQKYKEWMTGPNPPDVVILSDPSYLPRMVNDGLVQPLETYSNKEKFPLDGIVPVILEELKNLGNGKLYALMPSFSSGSLVYNKAIFDHLNLAYPTNQMSWEEIFQLARSASYEKDGEKTYGFSYGRGDLESLYKLLLGYYFPSIGLSMFDEEGKHFVVDNQEWKKAWSSWIELKKDKILPLVMEEEEHPFTSGHSAMTIMDYSELNMMQDSLNQNFDWDLVTLPIEPTNPDTGGSYSFNGIMVINSNSKNPDLAWDFISFMNGEKVAKVKAKADKWSLVSNEEYLQTLGNSNKNMKAFYTLKPISYEKSPINTLKKLGPESFKLIFLGIQEFERAINGEKSVAEALADYQKEGQLHLDQLNNRSQ